MGSKKSKQQKADNKKREGITPGTSEEEEHAFIAENLVNKTAKEKPKEKEPLQEEEKHSQDIKELHEVEHDITKGIEVRKLVKPSEQPKTVKKTGDLLGHGFHYFVGIEQKITHDFFFSWLPDKLKKYIRLFIPFILMAIVLKMPIDVEPQIRNALALFICISMLWALESISMIVTALLIPVLSVVLGISGGENPFIGFSNPMIYLLLSGLIIAQAFRKSELDKLIAVKVLSLSKGRLKMLLFYLMFVTAIFGMWMSNTATIALLIPVILTISGEVGHNGGKDHTSMFLLSAGFASSIGGLASILGGNANAITASFLRTSTQFDFLDWFVIGFPISVVLFIILYFTMLKIYRLDDEKIDIGIIKEAAQKTRFTYNQRKLLMIFIPTIFLWLFGGQISSFFNIPPAFYRTEIIGLSAAILLFSFRVLEWDDVRRIPWEIFLLVGGGLTLGQVFIDTGTASLLADKLFASIYWMPIFIVILVIVIIAMVLANFVNNSSATIILVPVLMEISQHFDISQRLLVMTAAMATAAAALTPIAMPSFSLIYGTGKVERGEMVKTGLSVALICAPVLAIMITLMNFFIS